MTPIKHRTTSLTLSTALLGIGGIAVLGFVSFNMRDILFGTPLVIHTAQDGDTLSEEFLPVTGKARHAETVRINGRNVFTDRDGNFADGVILSPGYNVVEVTLRDQFGKERVKTYRLVLEEQEAVAQSETIHYQQ